MSVVVATLLLVGLCIAGFVMGIISLTNSPNQTSISNWLSFPSTVKNGQTWPFDSGVDVIAGTFFIPQDGFLEDLSILGNFFSPDQVQQEVTFQVLVYSVKTNTEWQITGDGQNGVLFHLEDYSTSTTFRTSGTLKTYSGYAINKNRLKVEAGTQIQILVRVSYLVKQFINYLVSVHYTQ